MKFFADLFHSCNRTWRRSQWLFVRHLSEQATLYTCTCGREYARNHAVPATLPFDAEVQSFYRTFVHEYPPCTGECCHP